MTSACAPTAPAQTDDGFSLMELVVALVILGLVMSMIPRTLALASRAFRAADVIDARSSEAIAVDFISRRIAETMPVYRRSSDGLLAIAFVGREREISFVAPLSAGKDATGLAVFTLKAEPAGDDGAAKAKGVGLSWQIFRADTNPDQAKPPLHSREFMLKSEGFALRYRGGKPREELSAFGGDDSDRTAGPQLGDWQSEWTTRELLPSEVEITYKSAGGRLNTRIIELKLVTQR